MRSYKNYTPEDYLSNLSSTNLCDYSKFDDVDTALNHFLEKLNFTVNRIAPLKNFRTKGLTEEWFDGEFLI